MSREALKEMIDIIDEKDINIIFQLLIRFIPEDEPLPDEVKAITRANESIAEFGTVSMDDIDWD